MKKISERDPDSDCSALIPPTGVRERVYVGKVKHLSFIASILPAGAVVVCMIVSLCVNFEISTYTHCGVRNLLPSMSAMISQYPEKYVWKTALSLHFWPRCLMMIFYYQANKRRDKSFWSWLVEIIFLTELFSLMTAACVTSRDSFVIHRNAFTSFVAFSCLHMLVRNHHSSRLLARNYTTLKLVKRKRILTVIYFTSVILAALTYYVHNTYCKPGMYTLFALTELIIIAVNILYHNIVASDFNDHLIFMQAPDTSHINA